MEDFHGVPKPPTINHQPLIEYQVIQKVSGASVGHCRPIAYFLVFHVNKPCNGSY